MFQILIPELNSFPDLNTNQHLGVSLSYVLTNLAYYEFKKAQSPFQGSSFLLCFNWVLYIFVSWELSLLWLPLPF